MLTLGSLFDGIGGWQLAAKHAGIEPLWSSEIEPFPCAVTAKHFPNTVQLGDITKLDGAELPPVDIICAGSPCQDLSIAGKQEGLKGARSGLFLRAVDIVRRMRFATGGRYPRFFVWENVPGAFSSNRGMDFQAVLEEIGESAVPMPEGNRWAPAGLVQFPGAEIAWRVLDAQYWGVPQRRRRIFLVADFRGQCAGEILFERESVPWDSAPCRKTREGTSAGTESGADSTVRTYQNTGRGWWNESPIAETLRTPCGGDSTKANLAYVPDKARSMTARNDGSPCVDRGPEIIAAGFKVGNSEAAHSIGYAVETSPTLSAMDSGNKPAVAVYSFDSLASNSMKSKNPHSGCRKVDVARTLDTTIPDPSKNQGGIAVYENHAQDSRVKGLLKTAPSLAAKAGMGGGNLPLVCQKSVRRLTPTECERLQGLEDGYTLIDDKSCSDTARYKALGNGMAQPCADYVMRRIKEVTT